VSRLPHHGSPSRRVLVTRIRPIAAVVVRPGAMAAPTGSEGCATARAATQPLAVDATAHPCPPHDSPPVLHIGVLQFCMEIPYATSLKDKRRVVQSLKERVRAQFNVSVAEIDDLDSITVATMAAAMTGNDIAYINGAMDKLLNELQDWRDGTLSDHQLEIFTPPLDG
jgi:uncharacterized protein YlxP (DUF503 family)